MTTRFRKFIVCLIRLWVRSIIMDLGVFATHESSPKTRFNPKSCKMPFAHIFSIALPSGPSSWSSVTTFRTLWKISKCLGNWNGRERQGRIKLDSDMLLLSQHPTPTHINETDDANVVQRTLYHNEKLWFFYWKFFAIFQLAARWDVWCASQETGHVGEQQSTTYRAERTHLATAIWDQIHKKIGRSLVEVMVLNWCGSLMDFRHDDSSHLAWTHVSRKRDCHMRYYRMIFKFQI